ASRRGHRDTPHQRRPSTDARTGDLVPYQRRQRQLAASAAGTPTRVRSAGDLVEGGPPTVREMDRLRYTYLADLAQVMGIRPWETDLLTVRDMRRLCARLRILHQQQDGRR
ncbi:MAG: hypothetical protein WAW06_01610, partial [bacterium]